MSNMDLLRKILVRTDFLHYKRNRLFVTLVITLSLMFPTLIWTISGAKPRLSPEKVLSDFTITAYCPEACCNDSWAYQTATGKSMGHYVGQGIHIAATDPTVIPHGTDFLYMGKKFRALDSGGAIKGRRIDILFFSHEETVQFGVKRGEDITILQSPLPEGKNRVQ